MTTSVKKLPLGLIAGIAIAVVAAIALIMSYSSAVAFGAQQERAIQATQDNNRQILAQTTTRVREIAQVPAMARDDLVTAMEAAFTGRYGENGSQAMFQLIVENYPGQIDPSLYRAIQTTIESGRIEFQNNQTKLLDQKRVYQTNLDYVFRGFWLRMAGYPKMDLDSIRVVSSTSADRAFETGIDDGIVLRPEAPTSATPSAQ